MDKKTLVIGASEKPERYSYKAIKRLVEHGHNVKALSLRPGQVDNVDFDVENIAYTGIDTVTMYVGPKNQNPYFDYIESLKPRRVIFNPGTENPEFYKRLKNEDIEVLEACTLVLLATDQY